MLELHKITLQLESVAKRQLIVINSDLNRMLLQKGCAPYDTPALQEVLEANITSKRKEYAFVADALKAFNEYKAEEVAKTRALLTEQEINEREAKARGYGEGKRMGD